METRTDLTSILLELTQLNPLITLKEESFYISSFIFLLQTPERFTHANIPRNVLKLLEHRYILCTPSEQGTHERSLFDNVLLHSLDPSLHPGLLFLLFSSNSLINNWLRSALSTNGHDIITNSNLHQFRFTLETIFTHLKTSKHIYNSSLQQSVISEFLSSHYQCIDRQNSHFYLSLAQIFKLFSREALTFLLNSNKNGEVLLASLTAALITEHTDTYCSVIQCLVTLLTKLDCLLWRYVTDDLSLITNLTISPCLLRTLNEWDSSSVTNSTSNIRDIIFIWCIPYFSSIKTEHNSVKHSKIIFKWLCYLSNYSSSHLHHCYTECTFLDIILETLPMPDFISASVLACTVSLLFSRILLIAFEERLLELLISTKEDWLPMFLAIRTAFFKEQSPSVQSQLSFKYFQKENRFNLTSSKQDSTPLEVFRMCHEFIVKVFNSGLEKSIPCAESIVLLCKQRQPINKVGTKIVCLLKELRICYEIEESKPSMIIDLVDDELDVCHGNLSADPEIEEVYSRDITLDDQCEQPVEGSTLYDLTHKNTAAKMECALDLNVVEEFENHLAEENFVRIPKDTQVDASDIDLSQRELPPPNSIPAASTPSTSLSQPLSNSECEISPKCRHQIVSTSLNFPKVELPVIKNGVLKTKKSVSDNSKITKEKTVRTDSTNFRKRKIDETELDNPGTLTVKINRKILARKFVSSCKIPLNKPIRSPSRCFSLKKNSFSKNTITNIHSTPDSSKKESTVSPTTESPHAQVFDMSYLSPINSNDFDAIERSTTVEIEMTNKTSTQEESDVTDKLPQYSTQDIDRLRQDLHLSQVSVDDESEDPPILFQKKAIDKTSGSKCVMKGPKRNKTSVTMMRPPFSRSRLSTLTNSSDNNANIQLYKNSLYKNRGVNNANKSKQNFPSNDNGYEYPANMSLNLPDIDLEISPGKIRRMNEAAKLDIQPKVIPSVQANSSKVMVLSKNRMFLSPSPKRVYTQHAQGTTIITNPTTKINPDEHIDKILTWSPEQLLKDGCKPKGPPLPTVTPLSLSYSSYDDYKHMFTTFLLHETWSNLEEEIEKMDRTFREYNSPLKYSHNQYSSGENHRPYLARLQFFTQPDNEMEVIDFIKEQDIVLMQVKTKEPDPGSVIRLFGYINRVQVSKCRDTVDPMNKKWVSKVLLSVRYNTCHLATPLMKASLKPIMSLTTYNRQWRGLIHLYRSPICQYILSPNLRVCDPPRSTLSRVRIPDENVFNHCQKLAIAKIASMVSEPYVCSRIALLLGPPGCGKSHTVTGCVEAIHLVESSDRCKQHILLCAPSNASADELAIKMLERGLIDSYHSFDKTIQHILQMTIGSNSSLPTKTAGEITCGNKLSLIRLGQLEQVHPFIKPFHIDNLINNAKQESCCKAAAMLKEQEKLQCQLEGKIKQLDTALSGLKMQHQMMHDKRVITQDIRETESTKFEMQKKLASTKHEIIRFQDLVSKGKTADTRIKDSLLSNVDIILTTLSSSGISMMEDIFKSSKPMHFSCVIVDEATQCNELDILIPLQFMITKLVLVGDPNQLPAVVKSPLLQGLGFEMSLFERFKLYFKETCIREGPIILLDTQYRMHPEICHFPKNAFYEGHLHTASEVANRTMTDLNPYLLFHISYGKETSNRPGQIINAKEIQFVSSLVRELLTKHSPSTIGIITPYLAQLRELIKIIHVYSDMIDIKSVDGFQGKEKDIIIISCVRSKSKTGTIGFLSNAKRINVAITRARKALYIVGDVDSLKRNHTWGKLIQDAESRDKLVSIDADKVEECLKHIWLSEKI